MHRHKEAASILKNVMAVLRAKQKEVEAIEAQLAKMMDELRVRIIIIYFRVPYLKRKKRNLYRHFYLKNTPIYRMESA